MKCGVKKQKRVGTPERFNNKERISKQTNYKNILI